MKNTLMREKTIATLLIAIFIISTLVMAIPVSSKPPEEYSYFDYIEVDDSGYYLEVNVTEDGEWVTWEFDFPVEDFTGDGNLNVGLIIATDGDGEGPAFQIHNTDSNTMTLTNGTLLIAGTWAMSPWGPTTSDGWLGWHSGDTNTLVSDLGWVEASGDRKGQGTDGILTISIHESKLGHRFFWAASPTVGSGFWAPAYDDAMQVPIAFSWSTPIVDMTVPNYIFAQIVIPRPPPRKSGGPTYYDGVSPGLMYKTPHKLIVVNLKDAPIDDYYFVTVLILTEDYEVVYTRTFYVRPTASKLCLYLHESVFPDHYTIIVMGDTDYLPYLVASRAGIERSG